MTFNELKKAFEEKLGIKHLSDIARELEVTPQVVSNWKARDEVPYKYIKAFREIIQKIENENFETKSGLSGLDFLEGISETESTLSDNIIKVFQFIRKHVKIITICPIICLVGAFIYLKFFADPLYYTSAKLLPINESTRSSDIAGIASQFGFNLESQLKDVSISSVEIIPHILQSRTLANSMLDLQFNTKEFGDGYRLIDIIRKNTDKTKIWGKSARQSAANQLLKMFFAKKSRSLPIITLGVYSKEPAFAADLCSAIIENLENLITSVKLSQVKEKKVFIENRIKEILRDLSINEDALKKFREKNRDIMFSAKLLLEQERLVRDVQVQTQLYITLKSQFEMVRIEEVQKNTIVQVLDPPEVPDKKIRPIPTRIYFFAFVFGIALPLLYIILIEWFNNNKVELLKKN
jgi:uncharacterized protein involved in exopolysaccharide biosynthesis